MPVIPALVKEQKSAAAEIGCALFDTYTALIQGYDEYLKCGKR